MFGIPAGGSGGPVKKKERSFVVYEIDFESDIVMYLSNI